MPGVPSAVESHTFITATVCQARTRLRGAGSLPPLLSLYLSVSPTTDHHSEPIIAESEWESETEGDREEEKQRGGRN